MVGANPQTKTAQVATCKLLKAPLIETTVRRRISSPPHINHYVDRDTGSVAVKRLVVALDCGPISNPNGVKNQAEGGALHGMSRALMEEVTWDAEKVTSVDWLTYRTFPVGFKVPTIEVVLINQFDVEANGAGETSITVTAPAIGNAIFDATGVRIRELPFTPARIKAALSAASHGAAK